MKTSQPQDTTENLVEIPPAYDESPADEKAPQTASIPITTPTHVGVAERLRNASTSTQLTIVVALTIFIALMSFGAGIHYEKEHGERGEASQTMQRFSPDGSGRFRGGPRGYNGGSVTPNNPGTDDSSAPASNI